MAEKMTLDRAMEVLLIVTNRAMRESETREAYECVAAHIAQPSQAVDVPYDTALNDAGWAFTEAMPVSLPARIFNNVKPALKAAIEKWLQVRAIGNAQTIADSVDTHITQPAQAVDVGVVREVIERVAADNHRSALTLGVEGLRGQCIETAKELHKLTRAIGNAQGEPE